MVQRMEKNLPIFPLIGKKVSTEWKKRRNFSTLRKKGEIIFRANAAPPPVPKWNPKGLRNNPVRISDGVPGAQ
jgi:hypothetical protein